MYLIEVKDHKSLESLNLASTDAFTQAKGYRQILMQMIQNELGKVPINVEFRVIFPSIKRTEANEFFAQNQAFKNYQNHAFFADEFGEANIFSRFFNSSVTALPNQREFLAISELLVKKRQLKGGQIMPVITKDEIMFF